jgi:hypothetical protein
MKRHFILFVIIFVFLSLFASCKPDGYILSVIASPENKGDITIDPEKDIYQPGEEVTLTASPLQDYVFDEWYGDYESEDNPATITMDSNKFVAAAFRRIKPVIKITQGTDEIVSGVDTYDFGQADNGSSDTSAEFTIENDGEGELRLVNTDQPIRIKGEHANHFKVTQPSQTTIQEGKSVNFTLTFTPRSSGVKTAEAEVITNDTDTPLFTFGLTGEALPAWHTIGEEGASSGQATVSRTALSIKDGIPYVVYIDGGNNYAGSAVRYIDGEWESYGGNGFTISPATSLSLTFNNGTPYVSFQDLNPAPLEDTGKVSVMGYYGAWVPNGNRFSDRFVYSTHLEADGGSLYVAYSEKDNDNIFNQDNRATVMEKPDLFSDWQAVGTAKFSAGNIASLSLDVDSGTPYVAYQDQANSNKATVMTYDGSNWTAVGSTGFTTASASSTSIQVYNSTPYVAFVDGSNSGKASVMSYDGASWNYVGSAGFSEGSASGTVLFIEDDGTIYVAYSDGANGDGATVMMYDGASWSMYGNKAGFSPSSVSTVSLAVDSGKAYVAFSDSSNGGELTVMTYD